MKQSQKLNDNVAFVVKLRDDAAVVAASPSTNAGENKIQILADFHAPFCLTTAPKKFAVMMPRAMPINGTPSITLE
jgi:protein-disulfide isomerase